MSSRADFSPRGICFFDFFSSLFSPWGNSVYTFSEIPLRAKSGAAMVTYLAMNGIPWNCGEVEETAMVQRASAKEMKEDEWEAWVVSNVSKKE